MVNGDSAQNKKEVNGEICDNVQMNGNEDSDSQGPSQLASPLSPNSPSVENGADSWSVTNGNTSGIGISNRCCTYIMYRMAHNTDMRFYGFKENKEQQRTK